MLKPRIIPTLLVQHGGLVKTIKFSNQRYIGDPLNAVRIFNEKEADELTVLDISASREGKAPDYRLIERLANECRMPLSYGGGIKNLEQASRILSFGVEKIIVSSLAIENPKVISSMATYLGNQSVVVAIDFKKTLLTRRYEVFIHNGTKKTGISPEDLLKHAIEFGAGEILLNSIDRDGVMEGYDLEMLKKFRSICTVPMTVLGGAGSLQDLKSLIQNLGIVGVSAGSLFVYKGIHKAVLINYPNREDKEALFY
ncbi:AglZ/HisF2 family acetamidino modification protein [Leptospira interrogans]|uniref:Putative imidazole glycerol phosphate synthase subunit HisF n=1 Tax=Leptospira interrogans TaxID=173 RepID=HIS6_LEPIR|nr:AglZ/HisF2 family acetamidino modification protein [Leptospira interrogans]Q9S4H7.1 RecName: Full=Putative imidazole glycerol phosphate synthase subunit HisF; AltName: Full=IGP synthase cyclase subunit; AltName: Full=IGP synthase subunit HisF; AltName: Full=ImGP synthase subunit HisF; Short=IGPS subunit HisF [Leptospira interrogans]KAA1288455.1 imidazole glycerol phosphate synthase cyclase subunit [Leptospira interrogans serovar Geyaweera]AAD52165.1 unknown [Leptospira interrogans]MCD1166883